MRPVTLLVLIIIGLSSCNNPTESEGKMNDDKMIQDENVDKSLLKWPNIKDKFPYENIQLFDFDSEGHPKNDLNKTLQLDSLTFNELVSKVKRYSQWKEHLEIYYYSKNQIENREVGIFFVKREFDGIEYSFDLIQFDANGEIKNNQTLADSWTAAECIGYTRARINLQSNEINQEILQKCYDEKAENDEAIDSVVTTISLKDLDFNILKSDTIK